MAAYAVTLAHGLLDAGLIQFGWFRRDGASVPVALHLDMLASYPDLLQQAALEAQNKVAGLRANRLLCTADALPFGVAVSLGCGVPLVYSRGTTDAPVFDLVGAYDIGHPALLLTNSLGDGDTHSLLVSAARRVGLETHALLTILEVRPAPQPDDLAVMPLLRLADIVREMGDDRRLAAGHARAVLDWIESVG